MSDELVGFEKIEKSLLENFQNNQLHHGLLLTGNRGIGKASFALQIATKILLSSSINKFDDSKKIESNSHPDLLIIKKEDKKRDIVVDAVREITSFLSLTAAISKHRIIIIDAIDDLNQSSSNAILKTLEEPSKNIFLILINHNSAKVLDTIKSRCRLIKIANPEYGNFKTILSKNIEGIDEEEIKILAKISDNSIGSALDMYNYSAVDLYEQIVQLIEESNVKDVSNLAKTIAANEDLWNIFEKLIIFYFYNSFQSSTSEANERSFVTVDKVSNLFAATKNLNLDKSGSIINIFNIIKDAKN